jgi:sugar/nucleoside kinase (ribokinase family)
MPRAPKKTKSRSSEDGPVVVIGGANIDVKCRIAAATAMGSSNPGAVTTTVGGVARNVAENLARLGLKTALISAVGWDAEARRVIAETTAAGVDMSAVLRDGQPTGRYVATLDARGDLLVAVNAMGILEALTPKAMTQQRALIEGARLIIADCNLPIPTLGWLIKTAAKRRVPMAIETVSSPKVPRLRALLTPAQPLYALFGNETEMAALIGRKLASARALADGAAMLHKRGVSTVAIGLGRRGVFVSQRDGGKSLSRLVPAVKAKVVEVTGAGDAAVAATLYGLLAGRDAVSAARYGQAAAALTLASELSVSPRLNPQALEVQLRTIRR